MMEVHGIPLPPASQQPKKPKMQPAGEGRWIKPVDQMVEAKWYPNSSATASKSTWVPINVPRKLIRKSSSDEEAVLIGGFSLD